MNLAVDIKNLWKVYNTRTSSIEALTNINIQIAPKERVAVIGPSGCGKTTLLRIMCDFIEPTKGTVLISGKSPKTAKYNLEIGYISQSPSLLPWRNVEQNIALPLEFLRKKAKHHSLQVDEALEFLDLSRFRKAYPWQLSGGMQQRVALGRIMVYAPKLLLMDEPFGQLDELTRYKLHQFLMNMWKSLGNTVIFVTHSVAEAVFLADRIVMLTARPAQIRAEINVSLPHDRNKALLDNNQFHDICAKVRLLLDNKE
jgi:NitT/TauT family transport system ATP-binding protein